MMYYSKGNYEAFARPRKPANIETKSAYLVGGGLASLAAAAFLVRDGHMAGDRITILEASTIGGGALDGAGNAETGWLIRGGREMEDHFECLWDLYRSIPSLEIEGASVLDESRGFGEFTKVFAWRMTEQVLMPKVSIEETPGFL